MTDPLRVRLAALEQEMREDWQVGGHARSEYWANKLAALVRELPTTLLLESDEKHRLLIAALSALRSYQYGNAAPDLARAVADAIDQHYTARAVASEAK